MIFIIEQKSECSPVILDFEKTLAKNSEVYKVWDFVLTNGPERQQR